MLHRLTATFGCLDHRTLELGPGLNILEAPNESGKSTWCAFLLAMLYGIDSRQRDKADFIAEKNRYVPWSGAAMTGRLDCSALGRELTLTRLTRRSSAPMGEFTARYTGTAQDVSGLSGQNCGETLLGIPREVYARSAFIRQAGMGITASAELERRITALITAGDEETSFTEASAALKKQLNRRRHNRTGELPAAEEELAGIRRALGETAQLRRDLQQTRSARDELLRRQESLRQQLAARLQADASLRYAALEEARANAEQTRCDADDLLRRLEEDRIPDSDTVARLQGAIVNLEAARKSLVKARSRRDEAAEALLEAEAAAGESPFAGLTPEQAGKLPLDLPPKPRFPWWAAALIAATGAAFGYFIFASTQELLPAIGGGCGLFGFVSLIVGLLTGKKQARWEAQAEALRAERDRELDLYADLWTVLTETRGEADRLSAAADALHTALSSNEQAILLEVRRFAPTAFDIPAADAALRECAVRRKAAAGAQTAAEAARLRLDVLEQQAADVPPPPATPPDVPVPSRSAQELRAALEELQTRIAAETSAADRLAGSLAALGDPHILTARAEELEHTVGALAAEYDAIALAMSALEDANAELQARFAPALGRRAAEIFRELTGGRYTGVALDRSFRMAAEPDGEAVYRDSRLLSAGAADQLYLAVRLAICETVLPPETCPPIVLDDALINFDDGRCAAALRLLRQEAEHRQILLFTCHSREAEFFRNDPAVRIQRLTDAVPQV